MTTRALLAGRLLPFVAFLDCALLNLLMSISNGPPASLPEPMPGSTLRAKRGSKRGACAMDKENGPCLQKGVARAQPPIAMTEYHQPGQRLVGNV